MQPLAGVSDAPDATNGPDNQEGFSRGVEGSSKMLTSSVGNGAKRKYSAANCDADTSVKKNSYQLYKEKAEAYASHEIEDTTSEADIFELDRVLERDFEMLLHACIKWKIIGIIGYKGRNWTDASRDEVRNLMAMAKTTLLGLRNGTPLPDFKNLFLNLPKSSEKEVVPPRPPTLEVIEISTSEDEEDVASNSNEVTDSGLPSTTTSATTIGDSVDASSVADIARVLGNGGAIHDSQNQASKRSKPCGEIDVTRVAFPDDPSVRSMETLKSSQSAEGELDLASPKLTLKVIGGELHFYWFVIGGNRSKIKTFEIFGYSEKWSLIANCPGSSSSMKCTATNCSSFTIRAQCQDLSYTNFCRPVQINKDKLEQSSASSSQFSKGL